MAYPRRHRHWSDQPVGIRLDRVWRTVEQPVETFENAAGEPDHVQPGLPQDALARVRQPYAYIYGQSKLSLAPELVLARMEKAGELIERKPIRIPKPKPAPLKPEQNPDTFVPPPVAAPPVDDVPKIKKRKKKRDEKPPASMCPSCGINETNGGRCGYCLFPVEHDPCSDPDCMDPLYCTGHPIVESTQQRAIRLQRENDELKEKLRQLERDTLQPTELPVYVQPFVCSSCDQSSPMFDRAHSRCTAGECACYNQTPREHDATRRV